MSQERHELFVPKFQSLPPFVQAQFPDNPRDAKSWNIFWKDLLTSGQDYRLLRLDYPNRHFTRYIPVFDSLGVKRILFAGNGISVLPHLFCHAGFHAIGNDIASVATDFNRNTPLDLVSAYDFFRSRDDPVLIAEQFPRLDDGSIRQVINQAYRPGGSVRFMTADLFAYKPGSSHFDAIIVQNLIEHFTPADRLTLTRRLYQWLRPGGIAVVESQYLSVLDSRNKVQDGIETYFEQAGFLFHLKEAYVWQQEQYRHITWPLKGEALRKERAIHPEFVRRAEVLRAADFEQVRQGRKLVIFQFGR